MSLITRIASYYSPRAVPLMTRPSYRAELGAASLMPFAMAMLEGGVIGVLAEKAFHAPPMLIALFSAAPMFANLTSFAWARLARGRRKVRFIVGLQVAILLMLCLIAAMPMNQLGAWLLAPVIIAARCLSAGIITVRSAVWRQNYPRQHRGQITSRFSQIGIGLMILAATATGMLLDQRPENFRFLYPIAALVSTLGVVSFAHVRLRGERALLAMETRPTAKPQPHGEETPIYEYDAGGAGGETETFWGVLRRDPTFRWYMGCQFFAGAANMMVEPVIVYMVGRHVLNLGYTMSILITMAIPMALAVATMPAWGKLLDRVHVARFRVPQAWMWVVSMLLLLGAGLSAEAGAATAAIAVLIAARGVNGVARGGGMLAWQLGHNDFASRRMVSLYMGIHLTLTGVRGAFAPFLGMALFVGWGAPTLPGVGTVLPAFGGIGAWTFAIAAGCALVATIGYTILARRVGRGAASDGQ